MFNFLGMKEYFSHDYFSRNDPRILKLRMKLKWEGVGLYWALVEIAYEQGGVIESGMIESLAFDLRTQCERITDILRSYDLFYMDGENYRSNSIDRRLGLRSQKSEKAKKSAEARWNKSKDQNVNANAIRTQCDGNAIKVKESKVNNTIKTWRTDFTIYLEDCNTEYKRLTEDLKFIQEQEYFNPGVNIVKSIQKGYVNYWGTDIGWKHKKKSRTTEINWKSTIVNSISMNKVYLTKQELSNQ